jgi:hypothetical protein
MTRLEKCELLKSKGYTYDKESGKIFGVRGKEINNLRNDGYIQICFKKNGSNSLLGHHFAWYMTYGNVDFERLDHENRIKNDNRISNLRILTHSENISNNDAKGYSWVKSRNKWFARIYIDGKSIHLGYFNTEEQARQAYLSAKLKYHKSFIHSNQ